MLVDGTDAECGLCGYEWHAAAPNSEFGEVVEGFEVEGLR
jgi:hypothetical protein